MMKHAQYFVPPHLSDLSTTWISACMQPWTMWQGWARMWGGSWQAWLDSVSTMPNAWLPALAADRKEQPAAIDFFLPWVPRVEAVVTPLDGHSADDAVRVMLRAALPAFGGLAGEHVLVDAKLTRQKAAPGLTDVTPAPEVLPEAPAAPVKAVADPATTAVAPKRAPRRRKPAGGAGPA